MRLTWICVVLGTALFALACGSDPEEDFEEASQVVEEARTQVAKDQESVQAREEAAQKAQKELAEALSALRDSKGELARSETAMGRRATDIVLFRRVQKQLLEEDDLSKVAILVRVSQGVVTLSGNVPSEELRDRALEIARETPGVGQVESRIEVRARAAKKAD